MWITITDPESKQFINDQVEAGIFSTPQEVVEAAIERLMHNQSKLTDEDIESIDKSESQIDRGECVDFDEFAAEVRKKHISR
jgi:Arc/MetJ-type ribon-helix-helix transcriptional regulator